jgi:ketosteroid isomerase-like protein
MSAKDVQGLLRALGSAGWMDTIIEYTAPDVVAERLGFGGPDARYRGHAGLREWFQDVHEVYADFRLQPETYFDSAEQTLVLSVQRGRGRYSRAPVAMPIAQIFRWRSDQIVHIKTYGRRDDALSELGITEQCLQPVGRSLPH